MFHLIILYVHSYLPFLLQYLNDQQFNLCKALYQIFDYHSCEDDKGQSETGSEDALEEEMSEVQKTQNKMRWRAMLNPPVLVIWKESQTVNWECYQDDPRLARSIGPYPGLILHLNCS